MGRPLKLTETVDGQLKVGAIGNTAQSGNQIQGVCGLVPAHVLRPAFCLSGPCAAFPRTSLPQAGRAQRSACFRPRLLSGFRLAHEFTFIAAFVFAAACKNRLNMWGGVGEGGSLAHTNPWVSGEASRLPQN